MLFFVRQTIKSELLLYVWVLLSFCNPHSVVQLFASEVVAQELS